MNPLAGNPLKTRDDVAEALLALWRPLRPYYSASGARVSLSTYGAHFNVEPAELEGFARPLWGLAPLLRGGFHFRDVDLLLSGLAAGTDPAHAEYWGPIGHRDQRTVEAAAIAFALLMAPEQLWEPLSQAAKDNVAAWLSGALAVEVPPNNWNFFVVFAATALKRHGYPVDEASLACAFANLESYWIGDGWYRDGKVRQVDHYIGFAMHFYGLLYAGLADDPARVATYRERATDFAPHYARWFADDGATLPFGRSLTYRFAPAGFWGAFGFAAPHPDAKGQFLRHLRWWRDHADFDRDGVLPVGFGYPNAQMAEPYNSPQSPYWAFKAFVPLALPADAPFWTGPETPGLSSGTEAQKQPGFIVSSEKGQAVALSGGQQAPTWFRHAPEKYGKFAYSTRYGFSIESDLRDYDNGAFDSMLVLSPDGLNFAGRYASLDARMTERMLYSRWQPYPEAEVETWLVALPPGHLRVHRIRATKPFRVGEGGFAISREPWTLREGGGQEARIETATDFSGIRALEANGTRRGDVIAARPNTNLMVSRTWLPQLRGEIAEGETVLATLVCASPNRADAAAFLANPPDWSLEALEAESSAAPVTVGWDV